MLDEEALDYMFYDTPIGKAEYYESRLNEYRAKHPDPPKTNFERWKDSLTPSTIWLPPERCGCSCPAKTCPFNKENGYPSRHECAMEFYKWANATEEEK